MAFSIVILIFSSVLLLGFSLRSRYGLPLFLMTAGIATASVAVLFQVYSTTMYSLPLIYPFRSLEISLFRFIGANRVSVEHVQLMRNLGSLLYLGGICLLTLLVIRNLKRAEMRRIWTIVICIIFSLFGIVYLLYYSPVCAFRMYIRCHSLARDARDAFSGRMIFLDRIFRLLTLFVIALPLILLLTEYAKHQLTYFADTAVLLASMVAVYDALFYALFFTGPFAQRMTTVIRTGFWYFSDTVRIPAWIPWFHPLFSLVLLFFIVLNSKRIFSGELVLLSRKRALRKSIEDLNRNLKDVLHSEKNLMFSILILANDAKAAYGTPEGLKKLERLSEIAENRMENITASLNRIRELHLNAQPVDMCALVDEAIAGLTIPDRICCMTHYCSYPARCMVDEYHTRSALKNIFSNSFEALQLSPDEPKRIDVTVDASQEWVSISVRDNGPGIAKGDIRRVVLPFVSTKSKSNNWGIGLSYVFRIVNAQLGQMRITSSDNPAGHFTQVDILLPRERK